MEHIVEETFLSENKALNDLYKLTDLELTVIKKCDFKLSKEFINQNKELFQTFLFNKQSIKQDDLGIIEKLNKSITEDKLISLLIKEKYNIMVESKPKMIYDGVSLKPYFDSTIKELIDNIDLLIELRINQIKSFYER